jgi:hypothetical protein
MPLPPLAYTSTEYTVVLQKAENIGDAVARGDLLESKLMKHQLISLASRQCRARYQRAADMRVHWHFEMIHGRPFLGDLLTTSSGAHGEIATPVITSFKRNRRRLKSCTHKWRLYRWSSASLCATLFSS